MEVRGINIRKMQRNYLFIVEGVVIYKTEMMVYAIECFDACACALTAEKEKP